MSDELGLYEAMRTLRAVRKLRPDPIPDAVLRRLIEAASWAPTGGNVQPWRVILVKDAAAKQRLAELYRETWAGYAAGSRRALAQNAAATTMRKITAMTRTGGRNRTFSGSSIG